MEVCDLGRKHWEGALGEMLSGLACQAFKNKIVYSKRVRVGRQVRHSEGFLINMNLVKLSSKLYYYC